MKLFDDATKQELMKACKTENRRIIEICSSTTRRERTEAVYGTDEEIARTYGPSFDFCGGQKKKKDKLRWDGKDRTPRKVKPTGKEANVEPLQVRSEYARKTVEPKPAAPITDVKKFLEETRAMLGRSK